MEDQTIKLQPSPDITFNQSKDFLKAYANHVLIQQSAFDVTLVFGEMDQSGGKTNVVEQHTSITLSWPEAKLLSFFLAANILGHEVEDGKIHIPKRTLPQPPPELTGEIAANPDAIAIRQAIIKLREQFLAEVSG